jgi:hypothetical protein
MKKFYMVMLLFAAALFSCGGNETQTEGGQTAGEQTPSTAAEGAGEMDINKAADAYFDLKNALVSSDAGTAKIAANKLAGKLSGELSALATAVKDADELPKQREAFSKLSEAFYTAVKAKGGQKMTIYKQFCPMAFDNKGAFWLSDDKEIRNPYFGDEMLNCGEVQETLAAAAN